jgi:hypothetical protein
VKLFYLCDENVRNRKANFQVSFGSIIGKAITIKSPGFRTHLDSLTNLDSSLKCCADSKAIILSTQLFAKGNIFPVAYTADMAAAALFSLVCLHHATSAFIIP